MAWVAPPPVAQQLHGLGLPDRVVRMLRPQWGGLFQDPPGGRGSSGGGSGSLQPLAPPPLPSSSTAIGRHERWALVQAGQTGGVRVAVPGRVGGAAVLRGRGGRRGFGYLAEVEVRGGRGRSDGRGVALLAVLGRSLAVRLPSGARHPGAADRPPLLAPPAASVSPSVGLSVRPSVLPGEAHNVEAAQTAKR